MAWTPPNRTAVEARIERALRHGLDPDCEIVSRQRALHFACELVVEEDLQSSAPVS